MSELPEPLTPPECDLRDFQFMPLDIVRLFGSRFHAVASDAEWRAGVTLWAKSFHQVPAGSIPDDDVELCRIAELGRDMKTWKKLRQGALHGWVKCSDGRLYHPVVCEKALQAMEKKAQQRERTAAATKARLSRKAAPAKTYDERRDEPMEATATSDVDDLAVHRNVQRGDDVTCDVTFTKGQGEGQGQGDIRDNLPAQQHLAAGGGTRAAPENEFDLIADACARALGEAAPADLVIGPMVELARRHGLPRIEIALRSEARRPRRKPIRSWRLWAEIVADSLADMPPIAGGPSLSVQPPEPRVDFGGGYVWPHSTIIRSLERWAATGSWSLANRGEGDVRGIPIEIIPAAARELLKLPDPPSTQH